MPDTADPYRTLLARLETARAGLLESAQHTTTPEVGLVTAAMASAYLHAIADTVHVFEGPAAAQAYIRKAAALEAGVQS
ncbi:hypothetical protein ACFZAO_05585 [Streptomyces griseoaurantiacus]|uniref:hypothetical protein n=1 Tax=Streptomyces griseoaurantiacus TaxID=68213 RepID=UPI0036EA69B0